MTPDAHILQICNVGQIAGGTAACAWTLTQALPQFQHTIAFLSSVPDATRNVFQPHRVESWLRCSRDRIQAVTPDLVILHNVSPVHSTLWEDVPSIQYIHSASQKLPADLTVYCSEWLAQSCRANRPSILWQGVPRPLNPGSVDRNRNPRLKVGRLCTPSTRKWPHVLPQFYAYLTQQHPNIDWEFVGCPVSLQPALLAACQGRATFHSADWAARSLFWSWDVMLYHHPTLTESFGRTVAEAARTGCIPIVDDRGGFIEQLRTLNLRGCRSWSDFSGQLDALQERQLRQEISTSIQHQADEQFSIRAFGQRIQTLLPRLSSIRT